MKKQRGVATTLRELKDICNRQCKTRISPGMIEKTQEEHRLRANEMFKIHDHI